MRAHLPTGASEAWPPSEQELLTALENGNLSVRFAPMLDMTAVSVAALESTLAWDRGGPDPVPAARIHMVVERPGYTRIQRALLDHVLRHACARIAADAPTQATPALALLLARTQFFDPTLFSAVRAALEESGATPGQLELGVDERAVLSDLPAAAEVLTRLRELGVRTNLRGFGALTLEQLQSLPVSAVTVDFWNSRHDERIESYVADSVRTAHAAGLPVTAARAETPAEIEFARALGCDRLANATAEHVPATPDAPAPLPLVDETRLPDTAVA